VRQSRSRSYFGFEDGWHIYLCPQSLFKLHPDYYPVLAKILLQDPPGRLVFLRDTDVRTKGVQNVFEQHWPEIANRLIFLPRQSYEDFLALTSVANVMLDPMHFGGGNTSLEAFAQDTPIVTMAGKFLRSRLTKAFLEKMGLAELVVDSSEDYVAKAIAIASSTDLEQDFRKRINERKSVLYGDETVLRRLEEFFSDAITAARQGHALKGWSLPDSTPI
jgi:predicted O-linked N-acetylglucosamine transferase (SPINDLY family)